MMIQCHGFGVVLWSSDFEKSSNSNMVILWKKRRKALFNNISRNSFCHGTWKSSFQVLYKYFFYRTLIYRKSTIFSPKYIPIPDPSLNNSMQRTDNSPMILEDIMGYVQSPSTPKMFVSWCVAEFDNSSGKFLKVLAFLLFLTGNTEGL